MRRWKLQSCELDMINKEIIKQLYEDLGGHGFNHVERVHKLSMKIAEKEKNIDLQVIDAAAWLHDIARTKESRGECICHAEEGTKMAESFLKKINFPEEKIPKVKYAISVHRYSKNMKAETKEAEILQDADRLDALGAICIARVFMYNGHRGLPLYEPDKKPDKVYHGQDSNAINHFYEKILKIKPSTFHTKFAQKIAKERYKFLEEFLERFKKEWNEL